ncbi:Smr/MutS family protein [Prosthecomicrobium sp. N25]|uniref:Smr/MutS family protein n=1 Tax=Prosthecomicrobium sp. N25 TaxID=3129254 RepID=UPI0030785697
MASRRKRDLSEEERALWRKVAESVAPLEPGRKTRRRKAAPPPPAESMIEPVHDDAPVSAASPTAHPHPPQPRPDPAPAKPKARPQPTPLAPIDQRTKRKLVRGTMGVDERLDLHGMTQHEAHAALRRFVAGAQARGARMVIVITGKGARPVQGGFRDPDERGILRRVVPQWLALPDMRDYVVGFEEAHLAHGGAGALYVRLRKARRFRVEGGA